MRHQCENPCFCWVLVPYLLLTPDAIFTTEVPDPPDPAAQASPAATAGPDRPAGPRLPRFVHPDGWGQGRRHPRQDGLSEPGLPPVPAELQLVPPSRGQPELQLPPRRWTAGVLRGENRLLGTAKLEWDVFFVSVVLRDRVKGLIL